MVYKREVNNIAIKLDPGEEIHQALCGICERENVHSGFVLSGLGRLVDPELGYVDDSGKYVRKVFHGEHEMLYLGGNVSMLDGRPMTHLHVVLGDEEFKCFGGHLFKAGVGLTVEIMVMALGTVRMHREKQAGSELPTLFID